MNSYPIEPAVNKGELPDPLQIPGQPRISSAEEWPPVAEYWKSLIVDTLFDGIPASPDSVSVESLCHSTVRRLPSRPVNISYRIHCHYGTRSFAFCVRVFLPSTPGPHPVVINGDTCWWYLTDQIVETVIASGCALVAFNRTEIAEDVGSVKDTLRHDYLPSNHTSDPSKCIRTGGLYTFLEDTSFSATGAWAWGYHRCIDLLKQLPYIDTSRIAVSGHSRGAKAALLAGATDPRITLINDNAACAAGSPLFRYVGDSGETLEIIISKFPTWFNHQKMVSYFGKEETLPFDQHCFLATLAPRPVLLTYAIDDRWSNPEGMILSVNAARPVYELLGAPENLNFHLRQGEHFHSPEDWKALVAFIRWKWMGEQPDTRFNQHPYSHLPGI